MAIDIRESKISTPAERERNKPFWACSDNSFRFNFFTDGTSPSQEKTSPADRIPALSLTGQGSAFAFNFQIPPDPPAEDMDTTETAHFSSPSNQHCVQEEERSHSQGGASECEASEQSKTKKKKKTGKKKLSDTETQQKPTEGSQKEEELSPEEQLNRQLDWCIEQLELGIRSQKGTPKQKEEASRALKTLRSSKAPLVKKRQVMRAMTGDYRKQMEEEKKKQFKLIQSETASAQVKVASDSPKKSVFHRRAEERGGEMSELSDEASESEQLGASLSLWLGESLLRPEELDVPLDLHTACSIGQYDVVAENIKKREVDLDGKNIGGWTPLMYAAYIGHDNIANLLLEAGVNVNATTPKGLTPLMLAASCGNESIAYFLLQQGAELELRDSRGWTALFHCTSTGHQQMVRFLLDNNADANVREPGSGFTPLMEAAASGHEIIVQYLLDHKVKVSERDAKGETARALAMMYGYTKIVSLIDARSPRIKPGHYEDLSSSEDSDSSPPRTRPSRSRVKGISIHDGPQAVAKFRVGGKSKQCGSTTISQDLNISQGVFSPTSEHGERMDQLLTYQDMEVHLNVQQAE
ncbi:hypothetical protein ILYODFUR_026465 [Ilyodon furcidens]|uniref:Uncharacterized protein n=1 Tax=Ilyodon furcidens TaxID=33524 RepID=A0ABV0SQD9_9TELE